MLDNTITLGVDIANNAVVLNVDFRRYNEFADRSVYISGNHTVEMRDLLSFYRSQPKKSGNLKGVAKSGFKFTLDQEVPGVDATTTLTQPAIAEASFNFPVGVSVQTEILMRQRMIALLDNDILMLRVSRTLEV